MAELKKCPFCGGEAELYEGEQERNIYDSHTLGYVDTEYYTVHGVGCTDCKCIMAEFTSEEEAIEAWNNRVTEAEIRAKAIDEFAEKLKELATEDGTLYAEYIDDVAEQMKEEQ